MWDSLIVFAMQITSLGPQAVIVFFVLSGFCIAHSVEKSSSRFEFYLKRFIRLYPPYLGGLLLAWITYCLYMAGISINISDAAGINVSDAAGVKGLHSVFGDGRAVLGNLMYVPSGSFIAQYWSLTFEVMFYLIAPFVLIKKCRVWYLTLSAFFYLLGYWVEHGDGLIERFVFEYSFFFAVGVFFSIILMR